MVNVFLTQGRVTTRGGGILRRRCNQLNEWCRLITTIMMSRAIRSHTGEPIQPSDCPVDNHLTIRGINKCKLIKWLLLKSENGSPKSNRKLKFITTKQLTKIMTSLLMQLLGSNGTSNSIWNSNYNVSNSKLATTHSTWLQPRNHHHVNRLQSSPKSMRNASKFNKLQGKSSNAINLTKSKSQNRLRSLMISHWRKWIKRISIQIVFLLPGGEKHHYHMPDRRSILFIREETNVFP